MKHAAFLTIAVLFTVFFFATDANAQTAKKGNAKAVHTNWVDSNGDGICDNAGTGKKGSANAAKGYGKKDGTGTPLKPMDGTGYGKKAGAGSGCGVSTGSGICDGTGAKGVMARKGGKK